jgi:hypothetical protein
LSTEYLTLFFKISYFASSVIVLGIRLLIATIVGFLYFKNSWFRRKIIVKIVFYFFLVVLFFTLNPIDMKHYYLTTEIDINRSVSNLIETEEDENLALLKKVLPSQSPITLLGLKGEKVVYFFNHNSGVFRECGFAYPKIKGNVPKFLHTSDSFGDGYFVYNSRKILNNWYYICLYY